MQPDQVPLFREVKRKLGLPLKSDFKITPVKTANDSLYTCTYKKKKPAHTYMFAESLSHLHRIVPGQSAKSEPTYWFCTQRKFHTIF